MTLCCHTQTGDNSLSITELPVRTWTQPYKEFLEGLLKGASATASTAASRAKKADKDKDDAGVWQCLHALEHFKLHAHSARFKQQPSCLEANFTQHLVMQTCDFVLCFITPCPAA